MENSVQLANGHALYWKSNGVGGRVYHTDEDGGGILVWDTSLVSRSTLLEAIVNEEHLFRQEDYEMRLKKEWSLEKKAKP